MLEVDRVKAIDVAKIREDFPVLKRLVHGKHLVYLDNAATTQKPRQVIESITDYYDNHNANIHRSVHQLARRGYRIFRGNSRQAQDIC